MEEKSLLDITEWNEWRTRSLSHGGFGTDRVEIWPKLLHAVALKTKEQATAVEEFYEEKPHPDERQIQLDTDRSFVLYPVESELDKETLQSELNALLVEIFRRRPKLHYFQGYHDIITVLLLTLPKELQLACAEQLSLQRVRDSMGSTLEPMLGLLRVTRNVLRATDPDYAALLEQTAPLPYYALPNLLTLFSHDMPTLPLIQHVFDYLLTRPPIYVVYLACAIILSRKQEVERLEEEGEEGMIHSLLSALPSLAEDALSNSMPETSFDQLEDKTSIPEIEEPAMEDDSHATGDPVLKEHPSNEDIKSEEIEEPSRNLLTVQLTELLALSDDLYLRHPPHSPAIQLSSIMGPQSVVFTWSTDASDMPSPDAAEAMVERTDLIVYPEELPEPEPKPTRHRPQSRQVPVTLLVGAGLVVGVAVAVSVYNSRHGDPVHDMKKLGQLAVGAAVGIVESLTRFRVS